MTLFKHNIVLLESVRQNTLKYFIFVKMQLVQIVLLVTVVFVISTTATQAIICINLTNDGVSFYIYYN